MLRQRFNINHSCKRNCKIDDRKQNGGKYRCNIDIESGKQKNQIDL